MLHKILMAISYVLLVVLLLAPLLFFAGKIDLAQSTRCLNIATLGWFLTAPFWMNRAKEDGSGAN
jgi:hypothetical protein